MHRYAPGNPQHIHRTPPSGGLILHVKRVVKALYYEKFLFTVVKRNSLAVKKGNDNNNNNNDNNNNNNKIMIIIVIMIIIKVTSTQ